MPSTSSAPQRPQLEQRFAAAAMAPSGSLRSSGTGSVAVTPSRHAPVQPRWSASGKTRCLMRASARIDTWAAVNLANLDLNLLVSLDALLQQRSVTRAAAQMGLSQPALSASLARLRRHFGDELLTRVGNEYRLTPLAVQLRELARLALTGVERVFAAQPEFDPASSTREFSLLVSDYGVAVLGDTIAATARRGGAARPAAAVAPTRRTSVDRAEQVLLEHRPAGAAARLRHRPVAPRPLPRRMGVRGVGGQRRGGGDGAHRRPPGRRCRGWSTYHGPDRGDAGRAADAHARHRAARPGGHRELPDRPGARRGQRPRSRSLQRRLVRPAPARRRGPRALPCPVEVGPLVEAMWWHPAFDDDPEHAYLRDLVVRAAAMAVGGPDAGIDDGR